MKKVSMIVLSLCMMLLLASCGGDESQSRVISFSMSPADSGSFGAGAHAFAEKVAEYTDGRYTVNIYPSDQMANGSSVTSLEMLQQGNIDFVWSSGLIWSNIDPRIGVTALPWLFSTHEEALEYMSGEGGDALKEIVEECNVVCLGTGDNSFRQWTTTDRFITTPDDFRGLKFRVPGMPMYVDLFTMLGANPQTMNMSDVYISLQQGAIDGQENPIELDMTWNMFEVQKYLTICNYSYDPFYFCASHQFWDSLDDADKEAIQRAATEAIEVQMETLQETEDDILLQAQEELGVNVYELSAEELEVFRQTAAPIYEQYHDEYGEELLALFGYNS